MDKSDTLTERIGVPRMRVDFGVGSCQQREDEAP